MKQLGDATAYWKINTDPTQAISHLTRVTVQEGLSLDYIIKELADFLIVEHPRIPLFYLLPKIHKPGFPPKGCPIVAAQESLLEKISRYVDFIL